MVVIESLMSLYIKEVLIPDKVIEVVNRFSPLDPEEELPEEPEDAALFWINKCNIKLMTRIEEELANATPTDDMNEGTIPPMAPVEYLWDLSDGKSLASVLALYAPTALSWKEICYNEPMSAADCVYNLQMVQLFCNEHLPVDIFFMSVEDFFDCHRIIRPNILAFIADLLYHFEIKPAPCVIRPVVDSDFLSDDVLDDDEEEEEPSTTSSSNSGHRTNGSGNNLSNNRILHKNVVVPSKGDWESGSVRSTPGNQQQQLRMQSARMSNQTPRMRPFRQSSLSGTRQDQSYDDDGEVDEEMTRYFSALDLDPDFDSSPEIIMLPKDGSYSISGNRSTRTRKSSSATATTSGVTGSASTYNRGSRRSEESSNGHEEFVNTRAKAGHSTPSSSSAKRPIHPPQYPMDDPFYGPPGHSSGSNGGNNSSRFATYNKYNSPMSGPIHDQRGHRNQSIYDKPRMGMMHKSHNDLPAAGLLRRSNSNSQRILVFPNLANLSMSHMFEGLDPRPWLIFPRRPAVDADGDIRTEDSFKPRTQYKPFDTSPFRPDHRQQQSYHYPHHPQQQQYQSPEVRRFSHGSSSTEHSPDRQSFQRPHSGAIRRSNSTRTVDRRGHRYSNENYGHPDEYQDNYEPSPGYHEEYVDDHLQHQPRRGSFGRGHPADNQMSPIDTHIESQVYSDDHDDHWRGGHPDNRRVGMDRRRWPEDENGSHNVRGGYHVHSQGPPRSEQFRRRNSREDTLMERSYEGEELVNQSRLSHQQQQQEQQQPRELPADHNNRRNTWYVSNEPTRNIINNQNNNCSHESTNVPTSSNSGQCRAIN